MAESVITKNALADALRQIMDEKPFARITVSDIAERCGMNRKSFYYHFKDKYDLVNWIFDRDVIGLVREHDDMASVSERLGEMRKFCDYLYENRGFYRKVLQVKGQNSLSEHIREMAEPIIRQRIIYIAGEDYADAFTIDFITDAAAMAIEKWLLYNDTMEPEELISRLTDAIRRSTGVLYREINKE